MKFVYKSRFKEDYTTGIDLRNEPNNRISINPLGKVKGGSVPPEFDKDTVTIGNILTIAYNKFKDNMQAEEYPVRELTRLNIEVPTGFTALKSKIEGTVFVDTNRLYIGKEAFLMRNQLVSKSNLRIDERIEIEYRKLRQFNKDSLYVFQYID
jgi:hypothetical protein